MNRKLLIIVIDSILVIVCGVLHPSLDVLFSLLAIILVVVAINIFNRASNDYEEWADINLFF